MDATIIRSFQTAIFTFLTADVCRASWLGSGEAIPKWKDGSTVELIILRVQDSISAKYCVKCYDYKKYCKAAQWDIM